jgi:hypothetical protein
MDVSEIFKKVSNNGLVNPLGSQLSSALTTFTPPSLLALTQLAQEQAALTGAAVPDSGQLQAAILAIETAKTSTENLLNHTNKLSGVDLSSDVLTVIAKTMNASKSITGEKSCANVLAAFGSLQNMAAIVTDTIKSIKLVEQFLLDIPGQIAALPGQLNTYIAQQENQIIKDVAALAQARIVITQNAIATHLVTLISDPCVSEIMAGVMTAPLKKEVVKVADKLKTVQNMRVL